MEIKLNVEKINEVLVSFYEMCNIHVSVFDAGFHYVAEYPPKRNSFCKQIKRVPELYHRCKQSDIDACKHCQSTSKLHIYKCHAGLVEAVVPLQYEGTTIGYIMLGQITDIKDKDVLYRQINEICVKHGLTCYTDDIKYMNETKIAAAAKILEICAEYIVFKDMIRPQGDSIVEAAKAYIREHLSEQITVEDICNACGCGRTKLYKMFTEKVGVSISRYIVDKRMALAHELLADTALSTYPKLPTVAASAITTISERCTKSITEFPPRAGDRCLTTPRTARNRARSQKSVTHGRSSCDPGCFPFNNFNMSSAWSRTHFFSYIITQIHRLVLYECCVFLYPCCFFTKRSSFSKILWYNAIHSGRAVFCLLLPLQQSVLQRKKGATLPFFCHSAV